MRWSSLCVPFTAMLLICAKSSSSVRLAVATYLNKSLLMSCEQASISSIQVMILSIMLVMVLHLFWESLNSTYSPLSVLMFMEGRSGSLVFGHCGVVLGLSFAFLSWLFPVCKVWIWFTCCYINVSICCICCLVATVEFPDPIEWYWWWILGQINVFVTFYQVSDASLKI